MKKLFIILTLILSCSLYAQTPQQLFEKGNKAYAQNDYQGAIKAYSAILESGNTSAELYYNLGNAYYRIDEFGMAILNYERALRLKPNFRDARQNLELANTKTEDEISVLPELFITRWYRSIVAVFSPAGWKAIILIFITLIISLGLFIHFGSSYEWRKYALIGILVLTLATLISIFCCISASRNITQHTNAIVTSPMLVVKSSPENSSVDKLVLHEGTKVDIEEDLDGWYKIHIADGNTGWVVADEVTII